MDSNEDQGFQGASAPSLHYWLMRLRHWLLALDRRSFQLLAYAGLSALAFAQFLFRLGEYGIINGNESLYVESAREMLLSGDLLIPTLNGLPYLEKPPLFIWLIAASADLFGATEFGARMVTALAGFALTFATVRFSVLLGTGVRGFAAGFILVTTLGIDIMSRVAMPDLLLAALFAAACFAFLVALRDSRVGYLRLSAGLLGAAALVKGPVSIALFALIAAGFYLIQPSRRLEILSLMRDRWAALILVMPLGLWLAAIEYKQPGAASYYIINEHVLRFLGTREPHDYYSGSVFYYVPRLFLFFFPWVGVLVFGWLGSARSQDGSRQEVRNFLWLCVWIPFAFFTLSSAKANYYILLCVPPMALLTADYLPTLLRERRGINLLLAIIVPAVTLVAFWALRYWAILSGRMTPLLKMRDGTGPLTATVVLVMALIALALVQAGWRRISILCIGGLIVPVSFQFDHLLSRAEPIISARTVASYIQENFPDAAVFLYQDFEAVGALPIYLRHTVPVIDSKSNDLYFGHRIVPDHPNFVTEDQALASGRDALIVVMNDREQAFAKTGLRSKAVELTSIGKAKVYRLQPSK